MSVNVQSVNTQGVNAENLMTGNVQAQGEFDFAQLILQLFGQNGMNFSSAQKGENTENAQALNDIFPQLLENLNTDDNETNQTDANSVLAQILTQIAAAQNLQQTAAMQTDANNVTANAGLPDMITTGLSDSTLKNMETALMLSKIISGNESTEDIDFSEFSKLFNPDGTLNEALVSKDSVSVNPFETWVLNLSGSDFTDADAEISEGNRQNPVLSQEEEKINLLKEAVDSGKVTISKDINLGDVVGKMSENYRIFSAVRKTSGNDENIQTAEKKETSEGVSMGLIDYTSKTSAAPQQVKTDGTVEENAVYNQTLDSISRMMKEGKESYTAKLNPEGLGEIVIKMVREETGVVINIVASSARTAEILNNQLGSMQANLGDINAQIKPAEVAPTQESTQYQGYSFNGQDFGGTANQERQFYHTNQQYYRNSSANDDEVQQISGVLHDGKINTYI